MCNPLELFRAVKVFGVVDEAACPEFHLCSVDKELFTKWEEHCQTESCIS